MEQLESSVVPVWRTYAACLGMPSDMFMSSGLDMTPSQVGAAKAVCSRCMVVDDCLAYAITNSVTVGIWGGLSADELRALVSAWKSQRASTVA